MDKESLDSTQFVLHSDGSMVAPCKTKEEETLWTNEVRKILNSEHPAEKQDGPCTIFKVPEHIRRLDPKAYTPMVVSLGPFHHHNPCESSVMSHFKWRCVRHLLWRHGSRVHATQLLDKCLLELKKHDEKVRSCYHGELPVPLDAEKMALIMLLDGCFIIFLMLNLSEEVKETIKEKGIEEEEDVVAKLEDKTSEEDEGKTRRECEIENGEEEVVLNIQEEDGQVNYPAFSTSTFSWLCFDLLKLENQIPFFIIQLLFEQLKTRNDGNIDLVDLVLEFFNNIHPDKSRSFKKQSPSEYHHLFHLFYSSRIPSEMSTESTSAAGCICIAIEHSYSRWKKAEATPSPRTWASSPRWTPNATELDRAGVKFRKKESVDSFLNITFECRKITPLPNPVKFCLMFKSGRMKIPPLQIYSYTSHLFRNLLAFEQCYSASEMYITTYTKFMDCIIDQAEDVRLLRFEGILEHNMKNDQALAELFNQLGSEIHSYRVSKYLTNQIGEVITSVNEFYEYKCHRWVAGLRRDYLSSPWAIISVLAALVLLLLTIEQATFSALSYSGSS